MCDAVARMHAAAHPLALRDGLLAGTRLLAAAGPGGSVAAAARRCADLGATVTALPGPSAAADDEALGAAGLAAARGDGPAVLAVDAAQAFASAAGAGLHPLREAADGTWGLVRAVATEALIPAGAGRVVIVAPAPGSGPAAGAARAALENLARTLSVEWARHGVRSVAICPGDATSDAEIADLVAFLSSDAGDYFSGTALVLGAV